MFFISSDKTGGTEVFTLPAMTCTFLDSCVFIYTLEDTGKMNVKKKIHYDILSFIHHVL